MTALWAEREWLMRKYTVTEEMTVTKVKNTAKLDIIKEFEEFLIQKYGEENVGMVRYGTAKTSKNELAFKVGTVEKGGYEFPLYCTINPTVKDFDEKVTSKKTVEAFDFEGGKAEYDEYLTEKAQKQADARDRRNEKLPKVSKTKQQKTAELEAKKKALEEIQQRVKEKQMKQLEEKKKAIEKIKADKEKANSED